MIRPFFISGLPRSGSTLLSAILNQNPKFQASISGPLLRMVESIIEQSAVKGFSAECSPAKRKEIIKAIIGAYYPDNKMIFDTSRIWTSHLALLKDLYPETRMLCCVRDIPSILNSFEALFRKNPYDKSSIISNEANQNVYSRCDYLMRTDAVIGASYQSLLQGMCSIEKDMILLVEYEYLCKAPKEMMAAIYEFLEVKPHEHDFKNVASGYEKYDAELNTKGLHNTRKEVSWNPEPMVLPPDLIQKWSGLEVWRINKSEAQDE